MYLIQNNVELTGFKARRLAHQLQAFNIIMPCSTRFIWSTTGHATPPLNQRYASPTLSHLHLIPPIKGDQNMSYKDRLQSHNSTSALPTSLTSSSHPSISQGLSRPSTISYRRFIPCPSLNNTIKNKIKTTAPAPHHKPPTLALSYSLRFSRKSRYGTHLPFLVRRRNQRHPLLDRHFPHLNPHGRFLEHYHRLAQGIRPLPFQPPNKNLFTDS